ncbi:uncharacterized protein [Antedon mediterranea]|uniref:uncharacterized protein n=1 Tax=Antedon mediterranea TaxID=105859 RepID=UPI003AF64258
MGRFEVHRFVTAPDPDLICCVCCCVLDDPMVSPCQHVFCKVCISTWLRNHRSCPNCRAYLHSSRLKPVLPILCNMINRLQVRCENAETGCVYTSQLETYNNNHIDVCEYSMVKCKNNECNIEVLRKHLSEHENECCHRLTKCDKGCDLMFPLGKLREHNCMSELKVKLQKVEDNYQTVSTELSNLEKRVKELERHRRLRRSRTHSISPMSRRESPPMPWFSPSAPNQTSDRSPSISPPGSPLSPWYSPSGPNRRRSDDFHNNNRNEQSNRRRQGRHDSRRRGRHDSNPLLRGIRQRLRQIRSESRSSLFDTSISRSRSRSPLIWSSDNNESEISSSFSDTSTLQLSGFDSTPITSGDESFYSEMNRSFSSGSLTTDVVFSSAVENIEGGSSSEIMLNNDTPTCQAVQEETVNLNQATSNQVNSSPRLDAGNPQPDRMNTSSEVDLLSFESENQEDRNVMIVNVRRSSRISARRGSSSETNPGSGKVKSKQQSASVLSTEPILSRNTIEELVDALAASSSDESSWAPFTNVSLSDSSIDDEDFLDAFSNDFSSTDQDNLSTDQDNLTTDQDNLTKLLLDNDYNSSETDDTWPNGQSTSRSSRNDR